MLIRFRVEWLWLPVLLAVAIPRANSQGTASVWKTKPPAQWTADDAQLILSDSPWSKEVKATITRRQTEDELREAGQMGQPKGVGYDNIDPKGSGPKLPQSVLTIHGGRSERSLARPIALRLCWETAMPIRLAELKARAIDPPVLEGDGYRIAVYGIPNAEIKGDPKQVGDPLKKLASLKRDGKKDVRALQVEVFPAQDSLVVVYLFPLAAEITPKDGSIEFYAQIGRIVVNQKFDLSEMEFLGKLEL